MEVYFDTNPQRIFSLSIPYFSPLFVQETKKLNYCHELAWKTVKKSYRCSFKRSKIVFRNFRWLFQIVESTYVSKYTSRRCRCKRWLSKIKLKSCRQTQIYVYFSLFTTSLWIDITCLIKMTLFNFIKVSNDIIC